LSAAKHVLINYQRLARIGEQFREADVVNRPIRLKSDRTFLEDVILDDCVQRKFAPELCHSLALVPQSNFRIEQLFADLSIVLAFTC
jgi:hypothetical protein